MPTLLRVIRRKRLNWIEAVFSQVHYKTVCGWLLAHMLKSTRMGHAHTHKHTHGQRVWSLHPTWFKPPRPSKPRSPHFNEGAPVFHRSRCVALATRSFHLLIPYWVCIFRLSPLPPLLPASQSITLSSHLSLWLVCSSRALLQSIALHTQLTAEWQWGGKSPVPFVSARESDTEVERRREGKSESKRNGTCCMTEYQTTGGLRRWLKTAILAKMPQLRTGIRPRETQRFFLLSPHLQKIKLTKTDQLCLLHSSRLWFLKISYHPRLFFSPPSLFARLLFKGPRALFSKPVSSG